MVDAPPPSVAQLRRSVGRTDSFADLREWIRTRGKNDALAAALSNLDFEHRHAIAHFLWLETKAGVRAGRAKELLAVLDEIPCFAAIDKEVEWNEGYADHKPLTSVADNVEPPPEAGLPSMADFSAPRTDPRELFQKIRMWVRKERMLGTLAEAGAKLGSNYRAALFDFLASFCAKKTVHRSQAVEVLNQLSELEGWVQGDAFDRDSLASVLQSDAKEEETSSTLRRASVGAVAPAAAPVPRSDRRASAPGGGALGKEAKNEGPAKERGARKVDADAGKPSPEKSRLRAATAPADSKVEEKLGLPSASQLVDPRAEQRDLFLHVRNWVRDQTQTGTLEEAGNKLSVHYREALFDFLLNFVEKKTILRGQVKETLLRLAEITCWIEGGALDVEAFVELSDSWGDDKVFVPPTRHRENASVIEKIVQDGEFGGRRFQSLTGEYWADDLDSTNGERGDAGGAIISPRLPSLNALRDQNADPQEIMVQLCAWVEAGRRSGQLAAEAARLDGEHRRAITTFLCSAEAQASETLRRRRWMARPSMPKVFGSSPKAEAANSGVAPDRYYVLQSLAETDSWFKGDDGADRTAVSRALAQMPRAG